MSAPNVSFVPADILSRLATIKPYVLVVLFKGENYDHPDTPRIRQSEHLPHIFRQRDQGIMVLTMPVNDSTSRMAAIAIYSGISKEDVIKYTREDPAVKAGIFTYEVVTSMGLPGDTLS